MAPSSPIANEDSFIDDAICLDHEISMISNSLFKRQVSAPVRLSKSMFTRQISAPVHRLPVCEENVPELSDPEWEPDQEDDLDNGLDPFQSISAPNRQISDFSAPSRQVTAMSNLSSQDWEPIGASSIKRQETDEQWPTWHGKDPLLDRDQSGLVSHGSEQKSDPYMPTYMPPANSVDMHSVPPMFPQLYIWQLPPQTKQPETVAQPPFQRKRESLIDLAKQQQEQKARNDGGVPASSSIKFCPWCGGSFQPNFKFCVFCGNQFCPSNA